MNYCGNCQKCCKNLGYNIGYDGIKLFLLDYLKLLSWVKDSVVKFSKINLFINKVPLAKINYSLSIDVIKGVLYNPCPALSSEGCLLHNEKVSNDLLKEFLVDNGLSTSIKPLICRAYPFYVFDSWRWIDCKRDNYCNYSAKLSDKQKKSLLNEMVLSLKLNNLSLLKGIKLFRKLKYNDLSSVLLMIKEESNKHLLRQLVPHSLVNYLA